MRALITKMSTTATRQFRHSMVRSAMLLAAVALGVVLAGSLYLRGPSESATPASRVDVYRPVDQHERHPAGFPISH